MPLAAYDFTCDAGADWQRLVRLREPTSTQLIPLHTPVMEIRNANFQLALRLDEINGRCMMLDADQIQLHITANDSRASFGSGNFPGQYQAIGFWGIGRSYVYDMFAILSASGVYIRLLRGFFYVSPPVTNPTEAAISGPTVVLSTLAFTGTPR
jgi:hypothetical protein